MWDCYFEMWDEGEVGRRVDKYREKREFGSKARSKVCHFESKVGGGVFGAFAN